MQVEIFDVTIELIEDMLGTVAKNREVYSNFVAKKALASAERVGVLAGGTPATQEAIQNALLEEEGSIEQVEERGWTGFMQDERGDKFLMDYMIKGNLNAAADVLGESGDVKSLKFKFRRFVFVKPRRIYPPQEFFMGSLERPLRADTAQGPRVSLARSDVLKAGARLQFEIHVVQGKLGKAITAKLLQECLKYGEYMGLGQWRSGGFGRYIVVSFKKR
jgi:hypothetical protein